MDENPTQSDLEITLEEKAESDFESLLEASALLLDGESFEQTARLLFDLARIVTGARSGYVALLSPDHQENDVLFLESGGLACTVPEGLPMPVRGLRAEAYSSGKTVCENNFPGSPHVRYLPAGHVQLRNVAFVPLEVKGQVVGVMGIANKEGDFTEHDLRMATTIGRMAAVALRDSYSRDELQNLLKELDNKNRDLAAANERIRRMAEVDLLTGLATRRHFFDLLRRQMSFARRHDQPLALVLLDIDHFKTVNDTLGHDAGDRVLERFGVVIAGATRAEDRAGRYGGEEFVLMLPATDTGQATAFVERLRLALEKEFGGTSGPVVTASFGVTALAEDDSLETLLKRADDALYAAKKAGRNCVFCR